MSAGWLGRKRGAEKCRNSFKAFLEKARQTKAGKNHLARHHRGLKCYALRP